MDLVMRGQEIRVCEILTTEWTCLGYVHFRQREIEFLVSFSGPASLVRFVFESQKFRVRGRSRVGALSDRNQRWLVVFQHVLVREIKPFVDVCFPVHPHAPGRVATVAADRAPVSLGGRVHLHVLGQSVVRDGHVITMRTRETFVAHMESQKSGRGEDAATPGTGELL